MEQVRIVVFDLGGVLVRICRSWEEACARVGLALRPGWDTETSAALRRELSHDYHVGALSTVEFCERIAGTAPGVYSADEVRLVHDAWLIDEYVGVTRLIDEIHAAGLDTGVLSNTNEAHWERLAGMPGHAPEFAAPGMVRHLHASHLLKAAKPGIECFRAFEAAAGIPRGAEGIVFFDDMAENIAGAKAAGWRAHLVDHAGDTASQMRRALEADGVW